MESGIVLRRYHDDCRRTAYRWRQKRRKELGLSGSSDKYGCIACGRPLPEDSHADRLFCDDRSCRTYWDARREAYAKWHERRMLKRV